jgi:phage baseplate assembly protein V
MFDVFLRMQLGPIIERLAALEEELEDLRRRAEGHNRIGTIVSVDAAAGLCQVSHGELTSPPVKYFSVAAGEVNETRHPSIGEQCLLINYGGGDGSAQAMALTGLPSSAFPPVSTRAELHRRTYPDGTAQSYDHAASLLAWDNGPAFVRGGRDELVIGLGGAGVRITSAGVRFFGPRVDHNGINIGQDHRHKEVQPGPGTTGVPQ